MQHPAFIAFAIAIMELSEMRKFRKVFQAIKQIAIGQCDEKHNTFAFNMGKCGIMN